MVSKKSDFVILLCSIAHPVPGNVCTCSQNMGNFDFIALLDEL